MGASRFDAGAYRNFTASTVGKTTDRIYASRELDPRLDPKGVTLRESRDSDVNPKSTPIIVGIDVTGSMGMIADAIARQGLGTLFTAIADRKPISDPHVMFMAIGDAACDQAPLQVSQFEADTSVIIEQLTSIWLEKGGGGNRSESYQFPWYFAAFHTEHDSYVKRGKRGYLFTIGDEEAPEPLTREQIKRVCGEDAQRDYTAAELLQLAQRTYDVYHIVVLEGSHCRHSESLVRKSWTELIGQRVIFLKDHTKLAETIVSAIEVAEGRDASASAAGWDGTTARIVADAVKHLPRGTGGSRPALPGPSA